MVALGRNRSDIEEVLAHIYPGDYGVRIELDAAGRDPYSRRYSRIPPITFLT